MTTLAHLADEFGVPVDGLRLVCGVVGLANDDPRDPIALPDDDDDLTPDAEAAVREQWAAVQPSGHAAPPADQHPGFRVDLDVEVEVPGQWSTIQTRHLRSWAGTSIELAEAVADGRSTDPGGTPWPIPDDATVPWRVRVFVLSPNIGDTLRGDFSGDPVAVAGPGTTSLQQLAMLVGALAELPPIPRARRANMLATMLKGELARLRRAAVYEATRTATRRDVAAALDTGEDAIGQLITAHRKMIQVEEFLDDPYATGVRRSRPRRALDA